VLAFGKDVFASEIVAECPLPSVTLGKTFAECPIHLAKNLDLVVHVCPILPVPHHDST
jgi:hypothetical protein